MCMSLSVSRAPPLTCVMRCARWLRCAAATTAAADATITTTTTTTATTAATTNAAPTAVRAFRAMRLQPWQRLGVRNLDDRAELPAVLLHHGTHIGPRPLFVLDACVTRTRGAAHTRAVPAEDDVVAAAAEEEATARGVASKYEPMLTHAAWSHGAVHMTLHVPPLPSLLTSSSSPSGDAQDVLAQSCRAVCAVMDALGVRWTHVLAHGYGALVAARMACDDATLHRIGTLTLLDTPLATAAMWHNAQRRRELVRAADDVNVDRDALAEARAQLCATLEAPLPHVADADAELYTRYLFDPAALYAQPQPAQQPQHEGLVRNEARYVPMRTLAALRHPLQLIVPASGAVTDVAVHKQLFGVRRPAVVKAAATHYALFDEAAGAEVGALVATWLHRFEPDTYLRRRYEQAAHEMAQLMGSSSSSSSSRGTGSAAVAAADGGKQKKKAKEKKPKEKKAKK